MKTKFNFTQFLKSSGIVFAAYLLFNVSSTSAQTINIGPNQYAFRFTQNPNYGLFFNATNTRYEFRNGTAAPIFAFNADNGNMTTDLQFATGNSIRVAPGNYAFRSPAAPNAGLFFGATDYELRTTTGSAAFSVNAINSNAVFAGTVTAPGGNSTEWNQAHSWGNHASAGYLSTETDPVFNVSPAKNITAGNIANWNAAHSWGNHATAGYVAQTGLGTSMVPRWNGTQLAQSAITASTSSATVTGSPSTLGSGSLLTLSNPGGASFPSTNEARMQFIKASTQIGTFYTSGDNFMMQATTGSLNLRTGGSNRLIIDANGNVGIGSNPNSTARLAVNGQMLATQVRVLALANWPDYVFEEDYNLMSLDELAGFIKTEKHLPGIPSAREMESAESMDLGEMQRRTIEKVEELTLYILELKQLSDRLANENESLRSRIDMIEGK